MDDRDRGKDCSEDDDGREEDEAKNGSATQSITVRKREGQKGEPNHTDYYYSSLFMILIPFPFLPFSFSVSKYM